MHGAGPALAVVAAFFAAGQTGVLAQGVKQSCARIQREADRQTIYSEENSRPCRVICQRSGIGRRLRRVTAKILRIHMGAFERAHCCEGSRDANEQTAAKTKWTSRLLEHGAKFRFMARAAHLPNVPAVNSFPARRAPLFEFVITSATSGLTASVRVLVGGRARSARSPRCRCKSHASIRSARPAQYRLRIGDQRQKRRRGRA